jgi:capsular polysaccharide export protein
VPASLVIDRAGIYFDPGAPSELEHILQNARFSPQDLARAAELRQLVVRTAISKYNVGDKKRALSRPAAARVILVPGQVEDDASIKRGCVDVRTNVGLLAAVRKQHPDAYVIFKPHPDVTVAGRKGAVSDADAHEYANEVITNAPLPACLAIVDEVHTMTSLVGFEALLRGLRVHTYGQPFYAGWGLTHDRHPPVRRSRRLTIDELVAGVLLHYPRYLGGRTRMFTTPEVVVRQIQSQLAKGGVRPPGSRVARELRRAARVVQGLLDVP